MRQIDFYFIAFFILVVLLIADHDHVDVEHIEYCERVEAYEATKHLPEDDIQGHRNFKEIDCHE